MRKALCAAAIDSIVTLVKNVQDFALNLDHYMEIWVNALDKQFHIDPELYQQLLGTWEQILSFSSSLFLSGVQRLLGLTGYRHSDIRQHSVAGFSVEIQFHSPFTALLDCAKNTYLLLYTFF